MSELTLEELLAQGKVRSALILKGEYTPEEMELIRGVFEACNEMWAPVIAEHVELLRLWYERWRGFVAGTPDDMHLRTRTILDAHGVKLVEPRFQT